MPLLVLALVVIGGAAAVFMPGYLDRLRRELTRSDELALVARQVGLAFAATDPAYPGSTAFHHPFELFSRGVDQTCENFMTGIVDGVPIIVFDFLYRQLLDTDGDPGNDVRSEPIRHSCAIAAVPGDRPHVVIEPAAASRLTRADGEPVSLEWRDFNARYRVVSPERQFVPALVDLDLMAWLVDAAPALPLTWEVQRDEILCRAPSLATAQIRELVRAVASFAKRIGHAARS
jgi:hypothetical protein